MQEWKALINDARKLGYTPAEVRQLLAQLKDEVGRKGTAEGGERNASDTNGICNDSLRKV